MYLYYEFILSINILSLYSISNLLIICFKKCLTFFHVGNERIEADIDARSRLSGGVPRSNEWGSASTVSSRTALVRLYIQVDSSSHRVYDIPYVPRLY